VWDRQDVQQLLTPEEYTLFAETFGLNNPPNFEGHWHLRVTEDAYYPLTNDSPLKTAYQKLLATREKRKHPHRDEKIITSWNGLMIKGLAKAGMITQQANQGRFNGYLDDYAYLLDGILQLLEAKWNSKHLQFARELADALIQNFWDEKNYGFFFTSHDHEQLIYRSKPLTDDALPSGNGVAASALLKLGYLLGELQYQDIAEKTLQAAESSINHLPYAHNTLLDALQDYVTPPTFIIIRGSPNELLEWQQASLQNFHPQYHIYAISNEAADLPAILAEKKAMGKTVAYICEGTQCLAPVESLAEFTTWLKR